MVRASRFATSPEILEVAEREVRLFLPFEGAGEERFGVAQGERAAVGADGGGRRGAQVVEEALLLDGGQWLTAPDG